MHDDDRATQTPAQEALTAVWEAHMRGEFATHSVADTLATITADAHVNHVPVLTGGVGRAACGEFYGHWMLPGVAPTGRRVEVPTVAIVHIRDGKVASEHIYWDQASVLAQLGLLDATALPVAGRESAEKVLDPNSVPSNELIARGEIVSSAASTRSGHGAATGKDAV